MPMLSNLLMLFSRTYRNMSDLREIHFELFIPLSHVLYLILGLCHLKRSTMLLYLSKQWLSAACWMTLPRTSNHYSSHCSVWDPYRFALLQADVRRQSSPWGLLCPWWGKKWLLRCTAKDLHHYLLSSGLFVYEGMQACNPTMHGCGQVWIHFCR